MNYKPLSNHIFIEPIAEEQVTDSGIVLPDTAEKTKNIQGRIAAIGPGKINDKGERLPLSVRVGDTVLFKKPWSDDDKLKIEGKEYYLISEDDILAIIE